MSVLALSISIQVSKNIFEITNKCGFQISIAGRLTKNPEISNKGGTFIWHSKVANLLICSRMNFAHQ